MSFLAKLIITEYRKGLAAALQENGRITELHVEKEKPFRVGNLYVGRVQSILKNINAAFVDFGCGLNGYLPLEHQNDFFYTRQARKGLVTCGDELLVQVEKEPVKTKLPVLRGHFNLDGRYCVLIYGQSGISFSRKIRDKEFQKTLQEQIVSNNLLPKSCALIVRTNAQNGKLEDVFDEIETLKQRCETILATAPYRRCFSCLYQKEHAFLELIRDYPMEMELEVITDQKLFYQEIQERMPEIPVRLYEDPQLSLTALYSLKTAFEQALKKQIWLKSGGYLVLEPTEALTVIDVNTGKNTDKRYSKEQNFLRTNLEAAKEIALQLRLRNYSGIILVDFIDLESEQHTEELLRTFRQELAADRVKTVLVDMTKLHLAEVTRKRVYRPLQEAVKELDEEG